MKLAIVVLAWLIAASNAAAQFRFCRSDGKCATTSEPFRVCVIDGRYVYQAGAALCPCKDPKTNKPCTNRDGTPKGGEELVLFAYNCEAVSRLPHCNPPATFRHGGSAPPFDGTWTYVSTVRWWDDRVGMMTAWRFRTANGQQMEMWPFWAPRP